MKKYRDIETEYRVISNEPLTHKTWRMRLEGDTTELTRAGQFVNLLIEGKYLRRPISVSDYKEGELMLLYDVVGAGTKAMSEMLPGTKINTLTGLGNGFNEDRTTVRPVLLGGGIGCAPLLNLARKQHLLHIICRRYASAADDGHIHCMAHLPHHPQRHREDGRP